MWAPKRGKAWCPQEAKQEGDKESIFFKIYPEYGEKKRHEHPKVAGVSISSRNGAPSRLGSVVNGKMTTRKASNT